MAAMGFTFDVHCGSWRLSGQFPDLPFSMEMMRSVLSSSSCTFLVAPSSPSLRLSPVALSLSFMMMLQEEVDPTTLHPYRFSKDV